MAIASAVLQQLVETTKCKTLFITHYPLVAAHLESKFPLDVQNLHMGYTAESHIDGTRDITFLYRLTPGVTSGQYRRLGMFIWMLICCRVLWHRMWSSCRPPGTNVVDRHSTSFSFTGGRARTQKTKQVGLLNNVLRIVTYTLSCRIRKGAQLVNRCLVGSDGVAIEAIQELQMIVTSESMFMSIANV